MATRSSIGGGSLLLGEPPLRDGAAHRLSLIERGGRIFLGELDSEREEDAVS